MERLGLGPDDLTSANPRLIYARLTGWGQTGQYAHTAGHDINYIAISGALSMFCRHGDRPLPPVNLLGDFAGGALSCAFGITLALLERERSGRGQVVDAAMLDGAAFLTSFLHRMRAGGAWNDEPGTNMLDGAAPFYDTYRTADGGHMAVGAIEPQFYAELLHRLELQVRKHGYDAGRGGKCSEPSHAWSAPVPKPATHSQLPLSRPPCCLDGRTIP